MAVNPVGAFSEIPNPTGPIGDTAVSKMYLGDNEVTRMYLGDNLVYQSGPLPPPSPLALPIRVAIPVVVFTLNRASNSLPVIYKVLPMAVNPVGHSQRFQIQQDQ